MGTVLRDFYEVLDVERKATQDEVKIAYRKLALQWHPDKNPDRVDEATQRFKEIQNAYSVLSDPVERSWYDNHRESILRGEDAGEDADAHNDTSLNLWEYFRSSAYDDFTDSPKGFYTVYRKVFDTLDEEELSTSSKGAPRFGSSSSPWEEVALFYDYWLAFSSEKSFAWVDEYNVNVAPNRRIKRAMEKENKKERDAHRRAFNERVRQLAEYVQKRDPRVREQMLKAKQEKEEKEKRQKARRDELERDRQERLRRLHTERIAELQAEAEAGAAREHEHYDEEHHEEEEEDLNEFFCIACKKKFKSEKQWHNHEKSKKHLDNMASLRHEVMLDGEDDDEPDNSHEEPHHAPQLDEQELNDNNEVCDPQGPSASSAANQNRRHGKGGAASRSRSRQEENGDDVGSQSGDESRLASPPPANQRARKGQASQGSVSPSPAVGKASATSGKASPGVGNAFQAPAKSGAAAKSGGGPSTPSASGAAQGGPNRPSSLEPESDSESEPQQDEEEEGPGPSTINDTPVSGEEGGGSERDGEDEEGEDAGLEHMMAWASLHRKGRGGSRGERQTAGRGTGKGKRVESESEEEEEEEEKGGEKDEAAQPEMPAAGGSGREKDQDTDGPSEPSALPVSLDRTAESVSESAEAGSGEACQEAARTDLNARDSAAVAQDHERSAEGSAKGSDRSAVQKNGPKGGLKPPVKGQAKAQESKAAGPSAPPRGKASKAAEKKSGDAAEEFRCNVCRSVFATRNQLFKHINDSGHALAFAPPIGSADARVVAGSKGRRGKGASQSDEPTPAKGAAKGKKR